jgi:predicted permease
MKYLFLSMPAALPVSLSLDASPDIRVATATVAFAVVAALVFGLGPALRLARTDVLPELKEQSGDAPSRRLRLRWLTTRDALVMGQLALTFVMLTAAGLFVRGALEAAKSDPGFTLDRGIVANLDTTLINYRPEQNREFFQRLTADLRAMPGVDRVGLASHMPFGEFESATAVQLPGPILRTSDPEARGRVFSATTASIGTDYFAAVGVAMRSGREFTATEEFSAGGDPIAIIDESLARRLFGDTDPVGRQIQTNESEPGRVLRVVGVAAGVRASLFDAEPRPFLYLPFGQQPRGNMYVHAKTLLPSADAEAAMLPAIRSKVAALAATPPIVSLETRPMFRERNLLLGVIRTGAMLFAVFGGAALFLSVIGVYGVKAYLVARRTREIGVRVALGADPRRVVAMVLRDGLALSVAGLVAGAGLSVLAGTAMRSMLFQGRSLDLPVVALAAGTLVAAVLLASWLPARRATRVAPTQAMRAN